MKKIQFEVKFLTPAFLGNAEKSGQWRTPPFKALLRQWWRVAYAADQKSNFKLATMREEEGLLFGNTWLSHRQEDRIVNDYSKSLVRIRLNNAISDDTGWRKGTQNGVASLSTSNEFSYAWFGLAKKDNGQPDRKAIKSFAEDGKEGKCCFHLAYPCSYEHQLNETIKLAHTFGQLGSRSRGGWGAIHFNRIKELSNEEAYDKYSRPWKDCLNRDWAMSFACDNNGLWIWQSRFEYSNWIDLMKAVARERKSIRTALKSIKGRDLRPVLGFAIDGNRMPCPLRWKPVVNQNNKLQIRVFALPHGLQNAINLKIDRVYLEHAWVKICELLDGSSIMEKRN